MEDTTHADYMDTKRLCKDFEVRISSEYHYLYPKSDTLLLADVFKNFRKCVKNLSFRSCKIYFSSWISMPSNFKKDICKIRIINCY